MSILFLLMIAYVGMVIFQLIARGGYLSFGSFMSSLFILISICIIASLLGFNMYGDVPFEPFDSIFNVTVTYNDSINSPHPSSLNATSLEPLSYNDYYSKTYGNIQIQGGNEKNG